MFEKVSYLIMRHLEFLNLLCNVSFKTLQLAIDRDVDKVSLESANKDKLINILIGFHDQINQLIKSYNQAGEKDLNLESIFQSWAKESEEKIELVKKIDIKILELLNQEKIETKNEITSICTNRSKLKGYKIDSVK